MFLRTILVFVGLCLTQCSGTSTGPSDMSRQTQTFRIVSARQPEMSVSGARVVFDGKDYVASSQGTVTLPTSSNRSVIEVWADGFISPRKRYVSAGSTIRLIPDDSQLPFSWLSQVYYSGDKNLPLWRPTAGMVGVRLSDELLRHEHMPHAVRRGMATINAAQPHMKYFLAQDHEGIYMYLDPGDPYFVDHPNTWAFISVETKGYTIVSAKVVWKFITREGTNDHASLWHAVAHELGHHTGMWGHPPDGIMGAQWGIPDFSGREKEAMTYAFYREPGTRAPDDSTQIVSTPSTLKLQQATEHVVCALQEP